MNPRRPYRPDRKSNGSGCGALMAFAGVAVLLVLGGAWLWQSAPPANSSALTPTRSASIAPSLTLTLVPLPTETPVSTVTPRPTDLPLDVPTPTPGPTLFYTTQSGDTLMALAARFGITSTDFVAPNGLVGSTTLAEGQLLIVPRRALGEQTPATRLIPDSELIFSGAAAGFDPKQFALEQGGYLSHYSLFADELNREGGDVVLLVGQQFSLNPRLLTILLEHESGWVTNPQPEGAALQYPMGYVHPYRTNLYAQLYWAASQLSTGYYGWRSGALTQITFTDGTTLRLDPTLNAGTVALMVYFAQFRTRAEWEQEIGPEGFIATYRRFFGEPFDREMTGLIPADLTQPPLRLPFLPRHTWYFSGGPHGAWLHGEAGALAALDFAPGALEGGCAESNEWATAMAAGKIVRVDRGVVMLDLDGDGREATGWVILYLHIATEGRVPLGAVLEAGDPIGHPSCEGGKSTGTHLHVARKYNGEWILADGMVPFNMEGWVAQQGSADYLGALVRGDDVVNACTCTAAWTAITAGP